MGSELPHKKVKLVVGLIAGSRAPFEEIKDKFAKRFGSPDFISDKIRFNFTDYYECEFGKGLWRQFLSFGRLIAPEDLYRIKLYANRLENKFSCSGKRIINIDPGYLSEAKFVLATTKDQQHRLYINKGIYEEVALYFRAGSFRPSPWTYPDYRTKKYIGIFNRLRELYRKQVWGKPG